MAKGIAILLIASFFISSCALFSKKQLANVDAVEEVLEAPSEIVMQPVGELGITDMRAKLASIFTYALVENDIEALNDFLPTVSLLRMLASNETKALTDKEVKEKMVDGIVSRFTTNFEKLQTAIDENDIDRAKLKYKSYTSESASTTNFAPTPVLIVLDYDGKDITIPVTSVNMDAKCTLFEILKTTNIFSE